MNPQPSIITINWHEYPVVRLVIPFAMGIILAEYTDFSLLFIGLGFFISALFAYLFSITQKFNTRWFFGISLGFVLFFFAYFITYQHDELHAKDHFKDKLEQQEQLALVQINSMPETKKWVRIEADLLSIADSNKVVHETSGQLQLYIEKDSLSQTLSYGDLIQVSTKFFKATPPKNPNAFDFARYLHFKNIHYQAFVRADNWEQIDEKQGNFFFYQIFSLRKKLLTILQENLKNEEQYTVAAALTLGYRGALSEEIRTAYADTGAIHILAVSGLHVGLIYFILNWLLNQLITATTKSKKNLKVVLLLAGIWLFTLLTGASASVMRAATMFTFIILGKHTNRNVNIYNSLAGAAFCSLLINPYLLFTVGFQLSYFAVISIVFFQPMIYRQFYIKNKFADYFWQITSVSIAAQITVLPISLYYFHQFPIYFWLSSMIVIPAAFLILVLAILLFISALFLPVLVQIWANLLQAVLFVMNKLIFMIKSLPGGLIQGIWIVEREVILLYLLLISVSIFLVYRQRKFLFVALSMLLIFVSSLSIRKTQNYFSKRLSIYHVPKHTLIDFFDGQEVYTIQSQDLDKTALSFAAQQHRWALSTKEIHQFSDQQEGSILENNLLIQLPFLQFYDKKILLLNHNRFKANDQPLALEYLLIHGNPTLKMEQIASTFDAQLIIFDASNSQWKTNRWQKDCESLGLNCYDLHQKGAFEEKW